MAETELRLEDMSHDPALWHPTQPFKNWMEASHHRENTEPESDH